MVKKRNNIGDLLSGLKDPNNQSDRKSSDDESNYQKKTINPAINLATNELVRRASSTKEPVLHLSHDQVRIFKYHDRDKSSLDTAKVNQIRKSIEAEGQHFPGVVRKTTDTTSDGRMIYELVAGRLRFESSRGVGVFNAFLKELTDSESAKVMLSENEDRQDITPFERWLSIRPLIKDNILTSKEIASLINWDEGNLSRSLKAEKVYDECNLKNYLLDVSKVRLNSLLELAKLYETSKDKVVESIRYISETYPNRKDTLFLKAVIKTVSDSKTVDKDTLYLDGSKVKIIKDGDSVTLSFSGLPKESHFSAIIVKLKELNAIN